MTDRWEITWYEPHAGWRVALHGRSRFKALFGVLFCTLARSRDPHKLVWHGTHESRPAQREAEQGGEVER